MCRRVRMAVLGLENGDEGRSWTKIRGNPKCAPGRYKRRNGLSSHCELLRGVCQTIKKKRLKWEKGTVTLAGVRRRETGRATGGQALPVAVSLSLEVWEEPEPEDDPLLARGLMRLGSLPITANETRC